MLAILATHPIQYQAPIWQRLARHINIPFEVWYITSHGVEPSLDTQFGKIFKWDINLLGGYSYRFPKEPYPRHLGGFWEVSLPDDFRDRLSSGKIKALLVHGWNVRACWEAVFLAHRLGIQVWIRGESNDIKVDGQIKSLLKRFLLGAFFDRVDKFLVIGKANSRLYRKYNVSADRLFLTPYSVDNERFSLQANTQRLKRSALRESWGISPDSFCVLFVGKFVAKKRPTDIVEALHLLTKLDPARRYHALFVGAGELGATLRSQCNVVFDAERCSELRAMDTVEPAASFAGFMNQSDISMAYIASDVLVLPSDSNETWGLVVNEALASGLPCVVSDACGSAEDLVVPLDPRLRYPVADCVALAGAIKHLADHPVRPEAIASVISQYDFSVTVDTLERLWHELPER